MTFAGDRKIGIKSYEKSSGDGRIEKLCCTEAEEAKQLRRDELSIQEKESQPTVHQLTVQIQELQDKVSSLNDMKDFFDPETASSSGLSHVPSHLVSVPSPRGMRFLLAA